MFDSPDYFPQVFSKILNNCVYKLILSVSTALKKAAAPKSAVKKPSAPKKPKSVIKAKGLKKKKKEERKFTVDCTHPVEDNIMDVVNFVSSLHVVQYVRSLHVVNFVCVSSLHVANLVIQIVDVVMFAIKIFRCDQFCFLHVEHS